MSHIFTKNCLKNFLKSFLCVILHVSWLTGLSLTSFSVYIFLTATSIPKCYRAVIIHGFVEELVVNEDPEYQWIDRIRTPRASNEARQRLISLMSGINVWPGMLIAASKNLQDLNKCLA